MTATHSPTEWAAYLLLGVGVWATGAALVYLLAGAKAADFDPRPAARLVGDRLLVEIVRARWTVRAAALSVAALLMLLNPAAPEGAR